MDFVPPSFQQPPQQFPYDGAVIGHDEPKRSGRAMRSCLLGCRAFRFHLARGGCRFRFATVSRHAHIKSGEGKTECILADYWRMLATQLTTKYIKEKTRKSVP